MSLGESVHSSSVSNLSSQPAVVVPVSAAAVVLLVELPEAGADAPELDASVESSGGDVVAPDELVPASSVVLELGWPTVGESEKQPLSAQATPSAKT